MNDEMALWYRQAARNGELPPATGTAPVPRMPDEAFERLATQAERNLLLGARSITSVHAARAARIKPFWREVLGDHHHNRCR